MKNVTLGQFIGKNRDELIRRCRAKVATRPPPTSKKAEIDHGVPVFLDQVFEELSTETSQTHAISKAAVLHGRDLLLQGFTVAQVVHDYGDVCQSITDLAVEQGLPIRTEDFRTLNRCLDDAIAGAVTEFGRDSKVSQRDGDAYELLNLTNTAISGFEALQTGAVGMTGRTGAVVHHSLMGIRTLVHRRVGTIARPDIH